MHNFAHFRKSTRSFFAVAVAIVSIIPAARCQCDRPDTSGWTGSAYHGDWFTYQLKAAYADGIAKLDSASPFILSPRYPAPIRKVIVQLKCNSTAPSRAFNAIALIDGVETSDPSLIRSVNRVQKEGTLEYVHFDWSAADNATAVRMCLSGSGDGNWGVGEIYVFYGAKDDEEDALIRDLVKVLPAPDRIGIKNLSSDSLTLAAGEVEYAGGYRFSLERLEGTPLSTIAEDFAQAPDLSGSQWSVESENATFGAYTSSGYCDTKYAKDGCSLKIDAAGKALVSTVFTSETLPAAVTELRFMYKVGSTGKSNRFSIYARADETSQWTPTATIIPGSTSKTYVTNRFDRASGYRQVKVEFTAAGNDFTVTAIDSLAAVYGGDENRIPVGTSPVTADPECTFDGLAAARYSARAMAVAGDGQPYADSPWSEECIVDLSWADITVNAPGNIKTTSQAGKLKISWDEVDGADRYLVNVSTCGYPQEKIVADLECTASPVLVDVPSLGEYEVKVTAVSPGGCSTAESGAVTAAVELEPIKQLEWEAAGAESVKLDWGKVPLAEGYRVKTYAVTGTSRTDRTDYSGLPETWPEGWTHDKFTVNAYATPAPKIEWHDSWVASPAYPGAITSVKYSFKSHASEQITAMTAIRLDVSASTSGDDWREGYAKTAASQSRQEVEIEIPRSENIRRIRLTAIIDPYDIHYQPIIELGAIIVVYADEITSEVASILTEGNSATLSGLDQQGRYVFEVTPLPSEGNGLSAFTDTVDMSLMKPREDSPVCFSSLKKCVFAENFNSLAAVSGETPLREIALEHWQFRKGDDEPEELKYTKTGNATAGGVYVLSDGERSENSFALGTLATSSYGCALGIAFTNDLPSGVENPEISFTAVQRSFKASPKSHLLEYLVTDGATSIDAAGDWQQLTIPATAPLTTETREDRSEYRQNLGSYTLQAKIPPGGALVIRWRDPKGSSSPMMGIDDFMLKHPPAACGTTLTIR